MIFLTISIRKALAGRPANHYVNWTVLSLYFLIVSRANISSYINFRMIAFVCSLHFWIVFIGDFYFIFPSL